MLSATGRATLPVRTFCPPPVEHDLKKDLPLCAGQSGSTPVSGRSNHSAAGDYSARNTRHKTPASPASHRYVCSVTLEVKFNPWRV